MAESSLTGFKEWQNQTHSTSIGGRTIGALGPTVIPLINGIQSSSYLRQE